MICVTFGGIEGVVEDIGVAGIDDGEGSGVAETGEAVTSGTNAGTPGPLHAERMKQSHKMSEDNNLLDLMISPFEEAHKISNIYALAGFPNSLSESSCKTSGCNFENAL
jgi:hypothetical protein